MWVDCVINNSNSEWQISRAKLCLTGESVWAFEVIPPDYYFLMHLKYSILWHLLSRAGRFHPPQSLALSLTGSRALYIRPTRWRFNSAAIKTFTWPKCSLDAQNKQSDGIKVWEQPQHTRSSDPQNSLWQSETHFTNCTKLSNYSLLTRRFVSEWNILPCEMNLATARA